MTRWKPACAEPCALTNRCSCCGPSDQTPVMVPEQWARYLGLPLSEILRLRTAHSGAVSPQVYDGH